MTQARPVGRFAIAIVCAYALVLGAAPTPGDVGGCGRTATSLDERRFQSARKQVDCRQCTKCGIANERCKRACDKSAEPDIAFPETCHPLLHDGEVCLDALLAASCDDYAGYVDDLAPTTPTECQFCRVPFADAGAP